MSGFMLENIEAQKKKAEEYEILTVQVDTLKSEVSTLRLEIKGLKTAIEGVNNNTRIDIAKQLQQAAETILNPLQDQVSQITIGLEEAAKKIKANKTEDIKLDLIIVAIVFVVFCIPTFLAGWYFHRDDTSQRILWNQAYPNSQVDPFTSKEDFSKRLDNQNQYLDNQEKFVKSKKMQ